MPTGERLLFFKMNHLLGNVGGQWLKSYIQEDTAGTVCTQCCLVNPHREIDVCLAISFSQPDDTHLVVNLKKNTR